MPSPVRIFDSPALLATAAAARLAAIGREAIACRGRFLLALAGGRTPVETYRQLAAPPFGPPLDWSRTHVYFTDERAVPADHPDSNFGMASHVLLDRVPIPLQNFHRIRTELAPDMAATLYDTLIGHLDSSTAFPVFDLILLGLGEDGHIASLFPAGPELTESARRVVGTRHPDGTARISMTLPQLEAARARLLLVSGAGKAAVVARMQAGDDLPVNRVHPVELFLDRDAASRLPPDGLAP